jgi:predicted nucleic acid-binding Zn ribbon protein
MPRWDFKCLTCGAVKEFKFSSIEERDKSLILCECLQDTMTLLPCAPSTFILRGSGFYANDYKK